MSNHVFKSYVSKVMSLNVSFVSLKSKDIWFNMIINEEKQEISTSENLKLIFLPFL